MRVATRRTRVTLDQDRTIAAGESIIVYYIIVANSSNQAAEVCIQDADGSNEATITVPAQDSRPIEVVWLADTGLRIDGIGSDQVFVTVWHSSGGGA